MPGKLVLFDEPTLRALDAVASKKVSRERTLMGGMPYTPDIDEGALNKDQPWDELAIHDLRWAVADGRTLDEVAIELRRTRAEVMEKAAELGLGIKKE